MTLTQPVPMSSDWTPSRAESQPTVADVAALLAGYDVADIDVALVPHLAAAASELAVATGTTWTVSADDPVVVLLRVIAKVNLRHPTATGPFTSHLFDLLDSTSR